MKLDHISRGAGLFFLQFLNHIRLESLLPFRIRLQNHAAPDGLHWRIEAHDKTVASSHGDLLLQTQLHKAALARSDLLFIKQDGTA